MFEKQIKWTTFGPNAWKASFPKKQMSIGRLESLELADKINFAQSYKIWFTTWLLIYQRQTGRKSTLISDIIWPIRVGVTVRLFSLFELIDFLAKHSLVLI